MTKTETTDSAKPKSRFARNWKIYLIEFLIILIGGILVWKYFADSSKAQDAADREASIQKKGGEAIEATAISYAKIASLGLAMAVREEMLLENMGMIKNIMDAFVKEENVYRVILVDETQSVIVSTDPKAEEKTFKDVFPDIQFPEHDIEPYIAKSGNIRTFTTIRDQMGLKVMGKLIVEYKVKKWELEPSEN